MSCFFTNAKSEEPMENGTIFTGVYDNLTIIIHRIHYCDGWYLTCRLLNMEQEKLKSDSIMAAIEEAKEVIKHRAEIIQRSAEYFCKTDIKIRRKLYDKQEKG